MALREHARSRYPRLVTAAKRLPGVERWLDRHPPAEPQVEAAIRANVKHGDVVADVGAHHGTITTLLLELVGDDGEVIAVEAHPDTAAALRARLPKASVTWGAVTDRDGETEIYPGRANRSAEWNVDDSFGSGTGITVPTLSLDTLFRGRRPPSLIKMDIEGAEALALRGARSLIASARPKFIIEFHDEGGRAALADLLDASYVVTDLATGVEVTLDSAPHYFHGLARPSQ